MKFNKTLNFLRIIFKSSVLTTIVLRGGSNLEKLLLTLEKLNQRANKEAFPFPELLIDSLLQRWFLQPGSP